MGAAPGEQGVEPQREGGQGPHAAAAPAGANDGHHLSPSIRFGAGVLGTVA